jgi:hypothetical protein
MLISHSQKFIFFHMMKTGGKSVTRALAEYISVDIDSSGGREKIPPHLQSLMAAIDEEIRECTDHTQLKPQSKAALNQVYGYLTRRELPQTHRDLSLNYVFEIPRVFRSVYRSFINETYPKIYCKVHQHPGAREVQKQLPREIFDNYFKFSFVRHPLDWLVSIFFFFSREENENYHEFFKAFKGFADFIDFLAAQHQANFAGLDFFGYSFNSPQRDFLYDRQGNLLVDYVGKFENMDHDFAEICKTLGIPPRGLPHLNKSPHRHYSDYYTPGSKQLVYSILKEDFKTFGYEII